MKKVTKTAGVIIFCIGFVALFGEGRTLCAQLLWTAGAAALCLLGGSMLNKTAEEDEI